MRSAALTARTPAATRFAAWVLHAALFLAVASLGAQLLPAAASVSHSDSYYNYCLARQAWLQQDYDAALGFMKKAVEADPASAELALDLARLHFELNDHDEAARAARRAADLASSSSAAWRVLADALFLIAQREGSAGDLLEEAEQAYRAVIRLDPGDSEASLSLARLQISRGSVAQALDTLRRHLEIAPSSDEGIALAAQVLVRLKRFEEAESMLRNAIDRRPQDPQLHLALVESYEARGDLAAAMDAAEPLLGLRMEPLRARLVLARLSQKMGRYSDAFDHLREMSRILDARPAEFSDRDRAELQLRMVQALMDGDRLPEALSHAESAAGRFPAEKRFLMRKGETLLLLNRMSEAEALLSDKEMAPQISDTYLSAGARRERAGDIDAAHEHLKKSIRWNPGNAPALNYLGYMLADRNRRLDEAIGYIKRALDHDPDNGAYLDSLGWAYFKKGDYPRAEKALEQARASLGDEPAIHAHLGDLYYATGRTDAAVRAWQAALDRGVENADEIRRKLIAAGKGIGVKP